MNRGKIVIRNQRQPRFRRLVSGEPRGLPCCRFQSAGPPRTGPDQPGLMSPIWMRRICTNSPSGRLTQQDQEIPGRQKSGVGDVESFDSFDTKRAGSRKARRFPALVRAVMAARAAGRHQDRYLIYRFVGCGGADGVLDHAARTCRSEIIKDSSRALARAAEVFGELVPCVSFWSLTVRHPELVIGSRYRCVVIRQT
jgi:hypothetical protein